MRDGDLVIILESPIREHLEDGADTDHAAMARASGLENVFEFADLSDLEAGLDDVLRRNGPSFVVLEVEPLAEPLESPPIDGPELKFRFGRYIERTYGIKVFTDRV